MHPRHQLALPLETNEYTIRQSKRAKKLQLTVSPLGSVEVVVPIGMDQRQVPVFIAQHRAWIKQSLKRIQQQRNPVLDIALPEQIEFLATQQRWQVNYQIGAINRLRELNKINKEQGANNDVAKPGLLQLSIKNEQQVQPLLSRWLSQQAKQQLVPWLQKISRETALPYQSVTVRAQKTRWGSCSAKKNININRALLFLEPQLVRYVLVHELCHTRYLNHSPAYWALVRQFEPNYKSLDVALNNASYLIPRWAYPCNR